MTFPTRNTGYVSLQRNSEQPIYFLKTTDGGDTWEEKLLFDGRYFVQGMGFIDENTGWVGGNSSQAVLTTTDGGDTWVDDEVRPRINRIRFLSDSLGYAVGRAAYKIELQTVTAIDPAPAQAPFVVSAYPNPFTGSISVEVSGVDGTFTARIVDVSGRIVMDERRGLTGRFEWDGGGPDGSQVASGVYFVRN